jgi:6-phosphogluconolactonase
MRIDVLDDAAAVADHAATWMARRMKDAVRRRGVCRVAVSGGSTPAPLWDALARIELPWNDIHLYQVDERVAPDGDEDRNAVQLTEHLIDRVPIPKRNVHLMPVTAANLDRAAASYAKALGDESLDIVHLGIGDDGHTASWPPGDPVVDDPRSVALCGEFNGRVRMTLTPPVVNAARARIVQVVGAGKAEPLARWMLQDPSLPVTRVRRSNTTLVIDRAAAQRLPREREQ